MRSCSLLITPYLVRAKNSIRNSHPKRSESAATDLPRQQYFKENDIKKPPIATLVAFFFNVSINECQLSNMPITCLKYFLNIISL